MLKIRDDVDLKELEKYGFEEHYTTYTRDYNNGYLTMVDKETGEILKVLLVKRKKLWYSIKAI